MPSMAYQHSPPTDRQANPRWIVGLTGGIGSGKSTAAKQWAKHGITIVDSDLIAREVTELGTQALRDIQQYFGDHVLNPNGSLNRAALRTIIFRDSTAKQWLEARLHPLIQEKTIACLKASTTPYAVWVSPLLLETPKGVLCDRIVVVDIPEALQLIRASQRPDYSKPQVQRIMNHQIRRQERLKQADDILDNSSDLRYLEYCIGRLHRYYLKAANKDER